MVDDYGVEHNLHQHRQRHQHQQGGALDVHILTLFHPAGKKLVEGPVYQGVNLQKDGGGDGVEPGGGVGVHLGGAGKAGDGEGHVVAHRGQVLHAVPRHGAEHAPPPARAEAKPGRRDGEGKEGQEHHRDVQRVIA